MKHSQTNKETFQSSIRSTFSYLYNSSLFSDINVVAFEKCFRLHKAVLLSNRYFNSLITGDWADSNSSEFVLSFPDDLITLDSFTVAIKKIYGIDCPCTNLMSFDLQVLATSSYFCIDDLSSTYLEAIIKNITPTNFAKVFEYGQSGREYSTELFDACIILVSSQEAFQNNLPDLPPSISRNILQSDAFFCIDEYHRLILIHKLKECNELDLDLSCCTLVDSNVDDCDLDSARELKGYSANLSFTKLKELEKSGVIDTKCVMESMYKQLTLREKIVSADPTQTKLSRTTSPESERNSLIPSSDSEYVEGKSVVDLLIGLNSWHNELFQPFRFGYEFGIAELKMLKYGGIKVSTRKEYYCGSNWLVYFQTTEKEGSNSLGVYIQRIVPEKKIEEDVSFYVDGRFLVTVWFKIVLYFDNNTSCVLESKPDVFKHNQSWGWASSKMYEDMENSASVKCVVALGHI